MAPRKWWQGRNPPIQQRAGHAPGGQDVGVIDDLIQELADDVHGLLSSDAAFVHVPVYRSRTPLAKDEDGNPIPGQTTAIEDEINQALSGLVTSGGKAGLACVVLLPDVLPESPNSLGPSLELVQRIRIIEDRIVNEGPNGTGITASRLALHVVQLLNRRGFRGGNPLWPDRQKMIEEVSLPDDRMVHEVTLHHTRGVTPLGKTARPTVAVAGTSVTLACATAGATIHTTLDGGWPGPSNAAAEEYTGPITLAAGTHRLRACAYATDLQPSDDIQTDITITP